MGVMDPCIAGDQVIGGRHERPARVRDVAGPVDAQTAGFLERGLHHTVAASHLDFVEDFIDRVHLII